MSLTPPNYTDLIISVLGIIYFAYKSFVEPSLPAPKAAKINNDITALNQVATLVVQKIEQQAANLSPQQRKQLAIKDIQAMLADIGAPIPSIDTISIAIESAVWLLGLTQGKAATALPDKPTRQIPSTQRPDLPPYTLN